MLNFFMPLNSNVRGLYIQKGTNYIRELIPYGNLAGQIFANAPIDTEKVDILFTFATRTERNSKFYHRAL